MDENQKNKILGILDEHYSMSLYSSENRFFLAKKISAVLSGNSKDIPVSNTTSNSMNSKDVGGLVPSQDKLSKLIAGKNAMDMKLKKQILDGTSEDNNIKISPTLISGFILSK